MAQNAPGLSHLRGAPHVGWALRDGPFFELTQPSWSHLATVLGPPRVVFPSTSNYHLEDIYTYMQTLGTSLTSVKKPTNINK